MLSAHSGNGRNRLLSATPPKRRYPTGGTPLLPWVEVFPRLLADMRERLLLRPRRSVRSRGCQGVSRPPRKDSSRTRDLLALQPARISLRRNGWMEAEASSSDSTLADLGLRSSPSGYLIAVGQVRLSPQNRHHSEPEVPRPCRDSMHVGPDGTLEHERGPIKGLRRYPMEDR